MLVTTIIRKLDETQEIRKIDWVVLEWFEAGKRIQHRRSLDGREIIMKFLNGFDGLHQGDVLYEDPGMVIAIDFAPCDTIIIRPASMHETAAVCYEIGNKHLPLFYEGNELLVAFDPSLLRVLEKARYKIERGDRKLLNAIKTTVIPHGASSLFDKNINIVNGPA